MSQRVQQRRRRTIDEIVDTAIAVMSDGGAADLSLGEVARRLGMRTPSLYGYFASKAALCDEIFARGWRDLAVVMEPHYEPASGLPDDDLPRRVTAAITSFVGWALDHRASAELMFWRPIAAWEPSPDAYSSARAITDRLTDWVDDLRRTGTLRRDVDTAEMVDMLLTLSSGLITQQMANEPGISVTAGRFTTRIEALTDMFLRRYRSEAPAPHRQPADT